MKFLTLQFTSLMATASESQSSDATKLARLKAAQDLALRRRTQQDLREKERTKKEQRENVLENKEIKSREEMPVEKMSETEKPKVLQPVSLVRMTLTVGKTNDF
jgi:hypothetical protein